MGISTTISIEISNIIMAGRPMIILVVPAGVILVVS